MTPDEKVAQTGRGWRRVLRGLARQALLAVEVCLVLAVGLLIVLYAFQTRLIFPGATTQGKDEARVEPRPGTELLTLTTDRGDRVVALFGPALSERGEVLPDAAGRPTLLYFYGNGYNLRSAADHDFDRFRRLGVNMLIPDYVGYGMSDGDPSERGCYETADAAYDHLTRRADVDPTRIVAAGRSLGGAVAIDLASRRKVAGLVAFCTFTRMSEMARRRFPFLPLSLLLLHRFENLEKIRRVTCPILIGHGAADGFVPAEMSAALAAAATAPVTSFTVPGADHGDFYEVGGSEVLDALGRFLTPLLPRVGLAP